MGKVGSPNVKYYRYATKVIQLCFRQWCGTNHYHWWTASIKPRLLFSRAGYASWGLYLSSVLYVLVFTTTANSIDPATGLYQPDCIWSPYPSRQRVTASIMDHSYITSVSTGTHLMYLLQMAATYICLYMEPLWLCMLWV